MGQRTAFWVAAGLAAFANLADAQQPPPPPPVFAASNLTESGVRSLAANCELRDAAGCAERGAPRPEQPRAAARSATPRAASSTTPPRAAVRTTLNVKWALRRVKFARSRPHPVRELGSVRRSAPRAAVPST